MSSESEKIQSSAGIKDELLATRPGLLTHALKLTRSRDKAEDLVSDTIVRALRFQHQYEPGTSFKAWVHTIMRNEHYSQHRQAWRTEELAENWDGALAPTGDVAVELGDIAALLWQESHRDRSIIALKLAGVDSVEIAARMHIEYGTVKSALFRTRERLSNNAPQQRIASGTGYATVMAMIQQAQRDWP